MIGPSPLAPGELLHDRFRIRSVLGRGGFSIVYLAEDLDRNDQVVLKELAPPGSTRTENTRVDLGGEASLLRRKFLDEAAIQARLCHDGLVPVRTWFTQNGTGYIASDWLPDSVTVDEFVKTRGPLQHAEAMKLFDQFLTVVEFIHSKNILHRDIKPSNVLLCSDGRVRLIDFGSARDFELNGQTTHTVMFTPGYAPPEQLSEKARRGPATDIYGLCATLYFLLMGVPPPTCIDRSAGAKLVLPPDSRVGMLIESGLSLNMMERPQSVAEVRNLMSGLSAVRESDLLERLDDALYRSTHFVFRSRQCPSCKGVLQEARPIRPNICPVCREGFVRNREIVEKVCPQCRSGVLRRHYNKKKPAICPQCGRGIH